MRSPYVVEETTRNHAFDPREGEHVPSNSELSWPILIFRHGRSRAWVTAGLGVALVAVLVLVGQSWPRVAAGLASPGLQLALIGGLAGFAATSVGPFRHLACRGLTQRADAGTYKSSSSVRLSAK